VYIVFLFFAFRSLNDPRLIRSILYVLGGVAFVISVNCTIEYLVRERIDPTFGFRYGRYAEIFAAILPLYFAISLRSGGRRLVLSLSVTSLMWLAVLFSTSRGSLAAMLVGMTVFSLALLASKPGRACAKRLVLVAGWLLVLGIATQLPALISPNEQKSSTFGRIATSPESDPGNSLGRNIRFLFLTVGLEMFSQHPMIGVGADNFGLEFNKYRAIVSARPEKRSIVERNEDAIPERAHNEYLQVVSELGIPGGLIFGAFILGVAALTIGVLRRRGSTSGDLIVLAAVAGIVAFLVSSAYSSFSFRLAQNGVIFFFLLSLTLGNIPRRPAKASSRPFHFGLVTAVATLALCCCLALAIFSSSKAASQYSASRAESESDFDLAQRRFKDAIRLDGSDAGARFGYASLLLNNFGYQTAAIEYRDSINKGVGTSAAYSYLISAHSLAGEKTAALDAAAEAVKVFPYSVFLLTRYGVLLESSGQTAESEIQFQKAQNIDARQADTWRLFITLGARKAAEAGRSGVGIPLLADLYPQSGLYAVLAERQIIHPEERYRFVQE
jgi:O-antigen ligase